jgi:anti-sigma-K factor RskA
MNGHPFREEDFDLYALGALDAEEKRAIDSHLASCVDCRHALAEAQGRVAMLAFSAPRTLPSPAVKQRLMQQIRVDESAPAAHSRKVPRFARDPQPRGFFESWWNAVLVPAAALLAIATVWLWTQNRRLDRDLSNMNATLEQQRKDLKDARELADLIESRDTATIELAAQPGMPVGKAHVMYNAKMGMLMYDGELTPAPAAKSYQLWLVPMNGNPISAGVFNPPAGQPDRWMKNLPKGVAAKAFAITIEPAGGMPHPTGPMVMMGSTS